MTEYREVALITWTLIISAAWVIRESTERRLRVRKEREFWDSQFEFMLKHGGISPSHASVEQSKKFADLALQARRESFKA